MSTTYKPTDTPSAGAVRDANLLFPNGTMPAGVMNDVALLIDREARATHISPWRSVDKHGKEVARFSSEDEARLYADDAANGCAGYERTPNAADLLPAQIADALRELAKKDGVTIYLNSHEGSPMTWHVLESRPAAGGVETRGGNAPTYESALAACRAAEFSDGKERAK